MTIGWPQGIYLVLVLIGIGYEISRHGELTAPGRRNAWSTVVASFLVLALLWWGGFFR